VSAESGIPTFRAAGGLWEAHPIEKVASPEGFREDPERVWRFYSERRRKARTCEPNPGHRALVAAEERLEGRFLLATQNVDGLHRRAGSRRLVEIHGNLFQSRCAHCDRPPFDDERTYGGEVLPLCDVCEAAGWSRLPGRIAVFATGKLGGGELDYVSGLDLLYVYEPADPGDAKADELFQDIARRFTVALVDDSVESELYRVDVPARPGGPTTRLAFSLQQWESGIARSGASGRFALMKARPVAGDHPLCGKFMALVEPFVHGAALDTETAEEMFRLQPGRSALKTVELFTQTLQLMHGSDHPTLRSPNTLDAIDALAAGGFITRESHEGLVAALTFLRTVEHRLQLVQESDLRAPDQQELTCCARQLGFLSVDAMNAEMDAHRGRVETLCRIES
jgi:hypothetical protein